MMTDVTDDRCDMKTHFEVFKTLKSFKMLKIEFHQNQSYIDNFRKRFLYITILQHEYKHTVL